MAGMSWDEMTAEERLLAERLLAEQVVLNLRTLNRVERLAMEQGRELVRKTIEHSRHAEGAEVEKQVARRGSVDAG